MGQTIWQVVSLPPAWLKNEPGALARMYVPLTPTGNVHIILDRTFDEHDLSELCTCDPELIVMEPRPGVILDTWRHEGIRTTDFVEPAY